MGSILFKFLMLVACFPIISMFSIRFPEDVKHNQSRIKRFPIHLDSSFPRSGDCPKSSDGASQYFCPTRKTSEELWTCIDEIKLCDGVKDCPNAEDESRINCLFYGPVKSEIDTIFTSLALIGLFQPQLQQREAYYIPQE